MTGWVRPTMSVALGTMLAGAALALPAGCGGGNPTTAGTPSPSTKSADPGSPADQLAGRVAAAADHRYTAGYRYTPPGGQPRTVAATLATDGSWLFTVTGAGLGGGRDLAVAGTRAGVFQCGLGTGPSCVKVAEAGAAVPAAYDPVVETLFTTWLPLLANRNVALSVAAAPAPAGATGSCYSVEPTAASLSSPVPAGVYCLDATGVITGAQLSGFGSLVPTAPAGPAPATVTLPAPVTAGAAVPTASPPPPPTPTPSTSPSPSHH